MHGDGSSDFIYGHEGNDKIYGGQGKDYLYGNEGDDWLAGNQDNDSLRGGLGSDTMYGGDGNDTFTDNTRNNNSYIGGAGNDTAHIYYPAPKGVTLNRNIQFGFEEDSFLKPSGSLENDDDIYRGNWLIINDSTNHTQQRIDSDSFETVSLYPDNGTENPSRTFNVQEEFNRLKQESLSDDGYPYDIIV